MQEEAGTPLSQETPDAVPGEGGAPGTEDGPRHRRNLAVVLLLGLGVIALDQVTKIWAVAALTGREPVPVVGELLQLRLVYNPGAAFSLGTGSTWVFTILATVVVVVIIWQARHLGSAGWAWALGFLLGGAAGNLLDRLLRDPGFAVGHVVDFLALPNFPVFNVADSAITTAAVLIGLLALRGINLDGTREPSRRHTGAGQEES